MFTDTTKFVVGEEDRARTEWLQERRTGLGASDVAAIFGVSPYKSALALYHEKRGDIPITESEREALYWGRILQTPIARRYHDETRRDVEIPSPYEIRRHPNLTFMIATLDATATPTEASAAPPAPGFGTVEIKNAGFFKREEWRDEPPLAFQIQAQHQMFVTGAQWCSIAALVGGSEFFWADIARHPGFISVLCRRAEEFWQRVQHGTPPDVDGSEATRELLKQLYPKDSGRLVNLPRGFDAVDEELQAIKARMKKDGARRDELENALKYALGDATAATLENGAVYTYKTVNRREFVTAAGSYRTLRRKGE